MHAPVKKQNISNPNLHPSNQLLIIVIVLIRASLTSIHPSFSLFEKTKTLNIHA